MTSSPSQSSPPPPSSAGAPHPLPSTQFGLRTLVGPSLVLNAIVPAVGYAVLTNFGVSSFNALVVVALFPLLGTGISLARTRHLDAIGALSLVFIVVGLGTSLISGDERFLLLKESIITGSFGAICLLSLLLLPRPLMFYFGRSFIAGGDLEKSRRFDDLWQYPRFRRIQRVLTVVWGVGYLTEAVVRVGLLQILPITTFLAVSQVLALGTTVVLMIWTVRFTRAARARATEAGIEPSIEVPG